MKDDIRSWAAGAAVLASVVGFVALVLAGSAGEADRLLSSIALPALTFLIGFGSTPRGGKDA